MKSCIFSTISYIGVEIVPAASHIGLATGCINHHSINKEKEGSSMIRILSEGEEITVQTGKMEPLAALLIELSQVCNAVLGTLAIDAGCGSDDLKPVLLQMLQEDNSLEFIGHGSGTLHVMSN